MILYAWEIGAYYGHVAKFLPFAKKMRDENIPLTMVLCNPRHVEKMLKDENFTWSYSLKYSQICYKNKPSCKNLSFLISHGFNDNIGLTKLVNFWIKKIQDSNAKLIIADTAPVTTLAARILNVPVMLLGVPFYSTGHMSHSMDEAEKNKTLAAKMIALNSVNKILMYHNKPKLQDIGDLYNVEEKTMWGVSELNPYHHETDKYWGVAFKGEFGIPIQWPNKSGSKIFCYVRKDKKVDAMLSDLDKIENINVIVFAGSSDYKFKNMHQVFEPVHMPFLLKEVDLLINNANYSTILDGLMSGKMSIMLPSHYEQRMTALHIEKQNLGIVLRDGDSIAEIINKALIDQNIKTAIDQFVEKYKDENIIENQNKIFTRMKELLNQ